MDSFYASAEMRRDPSLLEKPVVIGADPKEGKGRGVVVSCNYAARKFGIRSATPISEAWRLCPQAVYLPPDFEYYESLSDEVMQFIRGRADRFEQVSIDEAFVELTGAVSSLGQAEARIRELKEELRAKTGLTCSVGLAENKSAAKIATDLHKPDGVTVVPPGETKRFLAPLPIGVIPGVGVKTELVLKGLGVTKVGDLQSLGVDVLKRSIGRSGVWLWEVANGVEREEVKEHELKSISTERTFAEDTEDWGAIEKAVADLAVELADRAQSSHIAYRRVGLKIRFRGFETHTKEAKLAARSSSRSIIGTEALSLLKSFRGRNRPVRLVGLKVSELSREQVAQTSMTSWIEKRPDDAPG
jgi:DNA polymerase IV (DinB-like DNA polymerase)